MARTTNPSTIHPSVTALLEAEARSTASRKAKPLRSVINDTAEAIATTASIVTDVALLAKNELTMLLHEQKLEQVIRLQELYADVPTMQTEKEA